MRGWRKTAKIRWAVGFSGRWPVNGSCNDLSCSHWCAEEYNLDKAQTELSQIQYFENAHSEKQREFINSQSNCVLCGTVLELSHAVDHIVGHIREEAHCTSCEVRTRARFHPLN